MITDMSEHVSFPQMTQTSYFTTSGNELHNLFKFYPTGLLVQHFPLVLLKFSTPIKCSVC